MILNQHVINDLTPIEADTKISELRVVFNQLTYSHIPIQKNGVFLGCLSENNIYCLDSDKIINDILYAIEGFYVKKNSTWLNVLGEFASNDCNIMPVLDSKNNYLGYYQLVDIISLFNKTPFLLEPGGIIIVEKAYNDYSLSEISQIIESNNVKLLGLFVSSQEDDMTQITIKIENSGLNAIFESLRRYGYNIILGHEDDEFLKMLKDRSSYLNRYLNL